MIPEKSKFCCSCKISLEIVTNVIEAYVRCSDRTQKSYSEMLFSQNHYDRGSNITEKNSSILTRGASKVW